MQVSLSHKSSSSHDFTCVVSPKVAVIDKQHESQLRCMDSNSIDDARWYAKPVSHSIAANKKGRIYLRIRFITSVSWNLDNYPDFNMSREWWRQWLTFNFICTSLHLQCVYIAYSDFRFFQQVRFYWFVMDLIPPSGSTTLSRGEEGQEGPQVDSTQDLWYR